MYTITLKKIESTHNNLRTEEVLGLAPQLPKEGKQFFMYTNPLDPEKDLRYVHTSTVSSVNYTEEGTIVFRTNNSLYELSNIIKETYYGKR